MNKVITIDGPAASGKSSVARRVAKALDLAYVNSGAMYRAVAWAVLEAGVDPADADAALDCFRSLDWQCQLTGGQLQQRVNGLDPAPYLEMPAVNSAVSKVARIPEIRAALVDAQRRCAETGQLVMEGRDIGTVVFPDSAYKFYIDASEEVRAQRRLAQGITDPIGERDRMDSTRKTAPLTAAADAEILDTSELSLEQVVAEVLERLRHKGFGN